MAVPPGPVTKHHQLALGKTDGMSNVQGVAVSTESTVRNSKGGW